MVLGVSLTGLSWLSPSASAQRYLFGRADFATGSTPYSVVTADLDGDGVMDLAATNGNDNTVSIRWASRMERSPPRPIIRWELRLAW